MRFSAAPKAGSSKEYYKNFAPVEADMADMGTYLRSFALSSYLYTDEVTKTAGGEACIYRRAGDCVVGAGNVLFFDFDSKYVPVSSEVILSKLKGVSSYLAPSKGWSKELEKYHVAVEVAGDLPMDKAEFSRLYRAAAQWLGFEGLYDPAMESWVQQIAPHGRTDAPEKFVKGAPINMTEVLAAYIPLEEEKAGVFAGDIDSFFTLSRSERVVSAEEICALVDAEGKQRVWCADGLEHDGRRDTAFVDAHDGEYYYHCSGGRCGHTKRIAINPFTVEAAGAVREEVREETLASIIAASPVFYLALDAEASKGFREDAINYALDVRTRQQNVAKVEGDIRRFDGVCWREAFGNTESIRRYLREELMTAGFVTLAHNQATTENIYKYYTKHLEHKQLKARGNYLNLQNGVLDIDTGELLPHAPEYLFTSVLPYSYDPKATAPTWLTVVDRVMCSDKDTIKAFKQSLGYLLLRSFNVEKMVGFVGDGENGKSTVLRVIKKLVGRSGYSAEPLKVLVKDNSEGAYSRARLAGKLVNITNELSPASLEADAFKDLISGEDITARNIFEAPFTLATVPKQVVAMNSTEALVKERTHGFMRRLHLIPFNYRLKDEHKDPRLDEKLDAELAGILNWCLEGAREALKDGKLFSSIAMKRLFEGVKRDANPVQQFMEEHIKPDDEHLVGGSEMHFKYSEFCRDNGYAPLGRNKMINELKRLGVTHIDTAKRDAQGLIKRVYGFQCKLVDTNSSFSAEVVDLLHK